MYKLFCLCLAIFLSYSKAEYDFHGLPDYHAGPVLAPSYIKAPVIPAPTYIKAIAPAPAPIYAHAAPVIKAIAPATSYATVTQVHVTHPAPVVKAVVAPPPIFKTILPAPIPIAHGLPHYSHYPH